MHKVQYLNKRFVYISILNKILAFICTKFMLLLVVLNVCRQTILFPILLVFFLLKWWGWVEELEARETDKAGPEESQQEATLCLILTSWSTRRVLMNMQLQPQSKWNVKLWVPFKHELSMLQRSAVECTRCLRVALPRWRRRRLPWRGLRPALLGSEPVYDCCVGIVLSWGETIRNPATMSRLFHD